MVLSLLLLMTRRYINGARVIEETHSDINGVVRVLENTVWGNFIQVGDNVGSLTQSGGLVAEVWTASLSKIQDPNSKFQNVLILGLGGGSAARLVRKNWPESKITGVEIDSIMVDMGMKYLGLSEAKVDIKIQDGIEFCNSEIAKNAKYDLILIDVYHGDEVPFDFNTPEFVSKVFELSSDTGTAIFNRLYDGAKRGEALLFKKEIEKYFKISDIVYPEANVMFICRKM